MLPSPPPDRAQRSFIEEARRAQIVQAAAAIVAEHGYARTSLARIAEHAGISKSVISYHFDGKDELMTEVVHRFFHAAGDHIGPRVEAETTSLGRILAWVGSQIEYFAAHRVEFLAMSEIVVNHRDPDGRPSFDDALDEEVDVLADLLDAGQRDGELRELDSRSVAVIIVRCTEGVLGTWMLEDHQGLAGETATLLDFIHGAIAVRDR